MDIIVRENVRTEQKKYVRVTKALEKGSTVNEPTEN